MGVLLKTIGVIGLLLITRSIFIKKETKRDRVSAGGGILLLIYSVYLGDAIFTILQLIFIISNLYAAKKLERAEHRLPLPISQAEAIKLATNQNDEDITF